MVKLLTERNKEKLTDALYIIDPDPSRPQLHLKRTICPPSVPPSGDIVASSDFEFIPEFWKVVPPEYEDVYVSWVVIWAQGGVHSLVREVEDDLTLDGRGRHST